MAHDTLILRQDTCYYDRPTS